MNKRLLSLFLCLMLLCGLWPAARAGVVTVGVSFSGVREENGQTVSTKLEGSFRVWQNGEDKGWIRAGRETLELDSLERITLEPLPETIALGWDLSGATVQVQPEESGTLIVPIVVPALSGESGNAEPEENGEPEESSEAEEAGNPEENAEPEETREPEESAEPEETGEPEERTEQKPASGDDTAEPETIPVPDAAGTGDAADGNLIDEPDGPEEPDTTQEGTEEEAPIPAGAQATPVLNLTAAPVVAATPEPQIPVAGSAAGSGSLRVNVFNDANFNGEQGPYESKVEGVTVYLLSEPAGEAAAVGTSDAEGQILLTGLQPGQYRMRVYLPEDWGFSKPGKDIGTASSNCMDQSAEGVADSDVLEIAADATTTRGIGIGPTIHVSGFCWLEETGDGIRREDERMLPGVRITLEGQKNGLFFETTTDAEGNWYIGRVRPGFYTLTAYAPEGMMFTRYSKNGGKNRSIFTNEGVSKASKTLDMNDKTSRDDQNIGFVWSSLISGRCFLDANYNGLYDEGEKPMPGVKVTAIKQLQDEEIAVTYSGEDGTFTLSGLRGNTYRVRAVLPEDGADFSLTVSDPLGNHFKARPGRRENYWDDFALADAEQKTVNIGVIYPGAVTGTVYMDDDFSAGQNGKEKTVSGFAVTVLDSQGNPVATDKTSVKGLYEITGLVPGEYTLKVTANEGYAFTRLGDGNVIRNRTGGEGVSDPFRVELGETRTGMDIGMILPGTVEGDVFADLNDNGLRDAGEEGMTGVTVRLINEEDGEEAFRAEIAADGHFLFDAVMPGQYHLTYELPEGAIFAQVVSGGNAIDAGGRGESFPFATGGYVSAPLCGALTLGRLSGSAFADHDGDGLLSAGEELLSGAKLVLSPSRSDLEELAVTVGEDGAYAFEDLHPDTYSLRVTSPAGTVLSRTNHLVLGLNPGKADQTVSMPESMGAVREGQALGFVAPASVEGRIWLDENNNGVFDEGEPTPSGERLVLTDEETGSTFDTLISDEEGRFGTAGMLPGRFTLSYDLSEDLLGAPAGDSTFAEENGRLLQRLTLEEGETAEGLLLGIVRYTSLSGSVWIDRGGFSEALSGAQVTLKSETGETLQQVTTSADGGYRFGRLMPGTYVMEADLPEGCVVVEPNDARLAAGLVSVAAQTEGRHGVSAPIVLAMGQDQAGLDFGGVLPGRLGDLCWLDLDGNGIQDYTEAGIPGVRIELVRNGVTVSETVSDQYGFYRFEEIYPATYTLRVTPPAEVKPTVRRTQPKLLVSVLEDGEGTSFVSAEIPVESDKANYNADLGFVLRQEGVMPEGVGEGARQNWTKVSSNP